LTADSASIRFRELFGDSGEVRVALAPGRVNLIGEHTDYNEGWALPMAIDRYLSVAFRPRSDGRIRAHACAFDETAEVELATLAPGAHQGWLAYVAGTAWAMAEAGHELVGVDCVIDGDVPVGAGLSSSAALEIAVGRALFAAASISWDETDSPPELARLGQLAENHYVGVACGRMDQLASACSRYRCALLIDFRWLETRPVPMPRGARVVVMHTGVERSLSSSAYNERRSSCEEALGILESRVVGARALRDVSLRQLEEARDRMPEVTYRRARHVIEENARPAALVAALLSEDLETAGSLMNDSHASLRDLYEVSSVELDRMTELAREQPGCFGARLTGAGFGGCAIALVAADSVAAFVERVETSYRRELELPARLFVCEPAPGVRLMARNPLSEGASLQSIGD
jgi:galactokinase